MTYGLGETFRSCTCNTLLKFLRKKIMSKEMVLMLIFFFKTISTRNTIACYNLV